MSPAQHAGPDAGVGDASPIGRSSDWTHPLCRGGGQSIYSISLTFTEDTSFRVLRTV